MLERPHYYIDSIHTIFCLSFWIIFHRESCIITTCIMLHRTRIVVQCFSMFFWCCTHSYDMPFGTAMVLHYVSCIQPIVNPTVLSHVMTLHHIMFGSSCWLVATLCLDIAFHLYISRQQAAEFVADSIGWQLTLFGTYLGGFLSPTNLWQVFSISRCSDAFYKPITLLLAGWMEKGFCFRVHHE